MNSFWKIASLAATAAALCGCSTMKDSTRFNDLPTHYWHSLATEPPNEGPVSP
jgi:ABC-type glycerol-3-phosphate transport system substrate-binding protein